MILIEGNWEEVNDLQDVACLVRSYYNSDLADEIEKLTPIHSDEEYQELLDKVYDLEKENKRFIWKFFTCIGVYGQRASTVRGAYEELPND